MSGAALSPDCRYRYLLWRHLPPQLGADPHRLLFCMLNPSTADASVDDPTIRRCIGFGEREAATRIEVVNLFAWRATDPRELMSPTSPALDVLVGPDNDETIRRAAADSDRIIVAWGGWGSKFKARVRQVVDILQRDPNSAIPRPLWSFDTTAAGDPRHPLYLSSSAPLLRWTL